MRHTGRCCRMTRIVTTRVLGEARFTYHRAERNRFYAISPFKPDLRGKSWDSQRRARNCAAKQWYCNGRVGLSSIALRAEHVPAALCQVCNVNGSRDACTLRAEKQFDRSFELVN